MPRRDQPYLPLYVQDYLTDEKLNLCSLTSQGVYIKLMCIMHKSEEYGTILLKQKDKQTSSTCLNFACKIARLIPVSIEDLESAISELVDEDVLQIEGDKLVQKRMVRDNALSEVRAEAGKKGGTNTQKFAKAKVQANSETDIVNENENNKEGGVGETKKSNSPKNKIEIPQELNSPKFRHEWVEWKKYKREEHNFKFKSPRSEKAALTELKNLSKGDVVVAVKIIQQSMSHGWKGLFSLKQNGTHTSTRRETKHGAVGRGRYDKDPEIIEM